MLIYVQLSSANVKAFMERDLATVLDIKRRHLSTLNITPEGKNLHRKRKRDATEGYKSADENEKNKA